MRFENNRMNKFSKRSFPLSMQRDIFTLSIAIRSNCGCDIDLFYKMKVSVQKQT